MPYLTEPLIFVHFKYTFAGKVREFKTPGSIINPENNQKIDGLLLWDTGATISFINSKFVPELGLKLKSVGRVHTANGVVNSGQYIAGIILKDTQKNETMSFNQELLITEVNLSENILGIIGMDIIGMGSFLLHYNKNVNEHILQFSYPGLNKFDNFNFEKERNKQNTRSLKNIHSNDNER